MELRQLRYFVAVAEHLHYGHAAQALNIQQPPLSQQIQRLEHELGITLFHRTSRRVEITREGEALLEAARRALGEAEHIKVVARGLKDGTAGRLRIGFVTSVMNWGLAARLRQYRERYPGVEVIATQMPVGDQVEALRDNEIDIGFTMATLAFDHLVVRDIAQEPAVVVLPEDHELAGTAGISLGQLREETFIAWRTLNSEHIGDFITDACARAGFVPRRSYHGAQSHTTVYMVAAGAGVAILPACDRRIDVDGVVFRDLVEPELRITLSVIHHRWHKPPMVDHLVDIMIDQSVSIS